MKGWFDRSKRLLASVAIAGALATPLLVPTKAEAWWGPGWGWHAGWGWHGGWGWRGGVVVGVPPVVVGAPVYAAPAYPYPYYGYRPAYRWIPAHYTPYGAYVPAHWGY